ncbi:hypothetical protein DIPPA_57554 [Diplonema papillatum]|nr:hypothetical protein DIPPA_57554 [Diplonema papillatum]
MDEVERLQAELAVQVIGAKERTARALRLSRQLQAYDRRRRLLSELQLGDAKWVGFTIDHGAHGSTAQRVSETWRVHESNAVARDRQISAKSCGVDGVAGKEMPKGSAFSSWNGELGSAGDNCQESAPGERLLKEEAAQACSQDLGDAVDHDHHYSYHHGKRPSAQEVAVKAGGIDGRLRASSAVPEGRPWTGLRPGTPGCARERPMSSSSSRQSSAAELARLRAAIERVQQHTKRLETELNDEDQLCKSDCAAHSRRERTLLQQCLQLACQRRSRRDMVVLPARMACLVRKQVRMSRFADSNAQRRQALEEQAMTLHDPSRPRMLNCFVE